VGERRRAVLRVRRALAIGAHPDDVEFQAGGTLARWVREGVHVELAYFTAGEKGTGDAAAAPVEVARVRAAEIQAAAAAIGAAGVHLLGAVDGELEVTMPLRLAVARLVRTVRPDVVLGHDPWRRWLLHPDHRAAGLLTVDGVVAAREPLYVPELAAEGLPAHRPHTLLLFGTDAPDEVVDISATIDAKLAALRCHASQIGDHADLARRVRTWNAAIGADFGLPLAEAFHLLDTRGR
jgi:LmbE family N-acetylglucosaminyl deacetylase